MILLKNCYSILADEGENLTDYDLLIKENRIEKLGRAIEIIKECGAGVGKGARA